jgi:hypothetical protein
MREVCYTSILAFKENGSQQDSTPSYEEFDGE